MSHVSRYLDPGMVEQLKRMQLSARSVVQGSTTGAHRSPSRGASIEFRQHRAYVAGDEPRRIDWRVLGRTDRHFVKEYDEETNLRCALLLDCSGSMGYGDRAGAGTKFDYAARVAAALCYVMLQQTESAGLAMFSSRLDAWLKPAAGPNQLARILDALDRASTGGESALGAAMHAAADRLERRALVIVISDFFCPASDVRQGLAHLRHDRHEVIAIQVTHRDEEEFPFSTWRRFRGLEGEAPYLAEPSLVRATYRTNFVRHRDALREGFETLGAEFASFVTDQPLIQGLQRFLRRREGRRPRDGRPAGELPV